MQELIKKGNTYRGTSVYTEILFSGKTVAYQIRRQCYDKRRIKEPVMEDITSLVYRT